jgi:hypothetical protein
MKTPRAHGASPLAVAHATGHASFLVMKNKMPRLLAVAFASCALLTAVSRADDPKPEHKDKGPSKAALEKYDANKDGKLDDAEMAKMNAEKDAAKKARLEKYDTNHDGKIDKTEAEAEKADKEKMKAEKQAAKEAKKAAHEGKKPEKQN